MAIEFKFPDVGEGIEEAEIVRWLIKEGDEVKEHQPLVEVETDKAIVALPSPAAGRVEALKFAEGATIHVGDVLVVISGERKPSKREGAAVVGVLPEEESEVLPAPPPPPAAPPCKTKPIIATPAVRRLAKELGVDLAHVEGSGPHGRILEVDVGKFAKASLISAPPAKMPPPPPTGPAQRVPLRGVRKAISKHLSHSYLTAVHVTSCDEADATALAQFREQHKAEAEKLGVRLTFMPLIIKAVVAALRKHPYLNSSLDDAREELVLKGYYNIGIGVDTPDGLMVPVIKNADKLNIYDLSRELERLAKAGRERLLKLDELKDGTFTISNVGAVGGIYAAPIINYPEAAVLVTGKIADRAVVRNGAVVARKTLPLSLAFDHRIVDGAEAVRFINDLIAFLERPVTCC
jgi:pyruvate dehydrogenase E2 component (dihydrolipoamide acetyltransferase)